MLSEAINSICHECGKERVWIPKMLVQDAPPRIRENLIPGFKCSVCGKLVPAESWWTYKKTGNVILRYKKGN